MWYIGKHVYFVNFTEWVQFFSRFDFFCIKIVIYAFLEIISNKFGLNKLISHKN